MRTERVFPGRFFRLLFLLILIFPARTFGQEGSDPSVQLTPVEVTSSRIPTPVSESTDSITIINLGEIKADSAPLVTDQIRTVPGVGVQTSGSMGEQTAIRIRGSEQYQRRDWRGLRAPQTQTADERRAHHCPEDERGA